jgi:hypothetical protein
MNIEIKNMGLDLAVVGSFISIVGVILNNVFLMHHEAMMVWCGSNILLMVYFYGHWKGWWDGGLSSEVIFVLYLVFTVTGVYGLVQ